jgi:exodeoxyribonuclease V gamma subunit
VAFPAETFFFGLGPFAQAYHEGFRALGARCRVNLYVTTPCREMWDDLRGEWDQRADAEDPFETDTRAHLALQRWGKAGREQVCQLCELTDWDVDMEDVESGGARLLQRLQDEILTLGTGLPRPDPPAPDDSIRILACPSPRREAEAVANAIWDTVLAGQGRIRFSDLAVVLPEEAKEDYLDHLRLALAGTRQIPWHLADQGPSLVRELADEAIQLLRLALTDRNRAQVLRVLGHPALARRWPDLPLERLPDYCERAGIVAGGGRGGPSEPGAPDPRPALWSWGRGFQRAALGQFSGGDGLLAADGDRLPAALPMEECPDLTLFLRALLQDLDRLEHSRLGPRDWAARLRAFLHAYLGQPEARAGEAEARAMAGLAEALERLEALAVPGLEPPVLGCREAVAVAEACFRRLLEDTLGPFERGVAVAAPGALRGIPFQAVFLMGLGEGVFPAADLRDPLDLRGHRRRPGDVRRSEQDRYLFLESLLAARERLVLSYVARDAVTGEELQPSPLILDLRDILRPALGEAGWRALEVRHPTHRHDLAYFPDLDPDGGGLPANHHPAARVEAEAHWIGERLRTAAGVTRLPGPLGTWGLSAPALAALEARVQACGPLAGPAGGGRAWGPGPLRISAGALRKWLECQIQGGAMLRLGLRPEAAYDPAEVAEEPFEMGFLERRGALQAALWEGLATERPAIEVFRDQLVGLQEAAKAPAGCLAQGELTAAAAQLEGWARLIPAGTVPWVWRFGPGRGGAGPVLPVRSLEALVLAVDLDGTPVPCRLEGSTGPQGEAGALILSEHKPGARAPSAKERRNLFRAWYDQVLLAAAGVQEGARRVLVFGWCREGSGVRRVDLPALGRDPARTLLAGWIREALTEPRWTLMPIEAVLDLDADGAAGASAMATWIDTEQESGMASFSSLYGPLPRAVEAPVEPAWRELARARMGLFLDATGHWEPGP